MDMCVLFVLLVYVDVGGPFFLFGGGGDSVGGEGGMGGACRQWICVFCLYFSLHFYSPRCAVHLCVACSLLMPAEARLCVLQCGAITS